jgi:heterodisulfide reductase subunit A2
MRVGVYFCNCGTNIIDKVNFQKVCDELRKIPAVSYVTAVDFLCSGEGKEQLEKDLTAQKPDRVVIAACSPREYENTFMQIVSKAGINPYLMQMVNIREQVAWVTPDPDQATNKACSWLRAAVARVCVHEPLEKQEMEACCDALVIGAGPAGLQAALYLAEAGRKVTLVEKTPLLGGLPVRYEELFPNMECGPCMLEPVLGEILHGDYSKNIEVLTLSEVTDVAGYYGNFTVKVKESPRCVDTIQCMACGLCIPPCPVSVKNEFNYGLNERKAIDFPFIGALPNAPFIDEHACLRSKGQDCRLCKEACPVEGAILFDKSESILERKVGAIIVAIGSSLYDCSQMLSLGYGKIADVYTSLEFERILASSGPTSGEIKTSEGKHPESIGIVHCVASLDKNHKPYCSGVCCEYAFKFNHMVENKLPGTKIYHLYKELVVPGKEEFAMYGHAAHNPNASFIRYADISDVDISAEDGKKKVQYKDAAGHEGSFAADMVILCPAIVPADSSTRVCQILDATLDKYGFFEELHGRLHSAQSKIKGIYLAGSCQAPMDIRSTMNQAMAAAGYLLSGLVEGKKLVIEPTTASIDEDRCSGCKVCGSVCPYKAISFIEDKQVSSVNALLCHGCGTCVAACPASAIKGYHFTNEQIFAEIEAVLQ